MGNRKRKRKEWVEAPYALADVWPNGDVDIRDDIRFTRPLTEAEMRDGMRNGFDKYGIRKP